MQQVEPVEREVIRILHKRLRVDICYSDDTAYLAKSIDMTAQWDVSRLKREYLIYSFLKKWKGLETDLDLKALTFSSWIAAEQQCYRTNVRLENEARIGFTPPVTRVILRAQDIIASILGPISYDRIGALCGHSAGATTDNRRGTTLAQKILRKPSITRACIPLYLKLTQDDVHYAYQQGFDFEVVRENRCVMVPKSAKINRMIAAEPTLNVFVQQGIGRFIRERLMRAGVNLSDQTINKDYAFCALLDGLSTIDLSMASDTLSFNLVKLLLPRSWYELLAQARCTHSRYEGKNYQLSKFSSMGNSFTFELESLIFYALVKACSKNEDDTVSVYGDDIVCTNENFPHVLETLTWAGFTLNADKSFTDGSRFFESCGGHFYDMEDITPLYQKDVCRSPVDYIRLHNRLVRAGKRLGLRNEVKDACRCVVDRYRREFPTVPVAYGPLVEGDFFFIEEGALPKTDRFKLLCLQRKTIGLAIPKLHEQALYTYALRRSDYSNIDPKGYAVVEGPETYVWKYVWFWQSALLESRESRNAQTTRHS